MGVVLLSLGRRILTICILYMYSRLNSNMRLMSQISCLYCVLFMPEFPGKNLINNAVSVPDMTKQLPLHRHQEGFWVSVRVSQKVCAGGML